MDNSLDAARGQRLSIAIEIDRAGGRLVYSCNGGLGMGPEGLASFLSWGETAHSADDIGFYGQGGKAALGYLAHGLNLWSKPMAEDVCYRISDGSWADRTVAATYEVSPLDRSLAPGPVGEASADRGHVWIEAAPLRACGFDFASDRLPGVALEVKGIRESSGGILFTEREWTEAARRREDYWVVVVGNLVARPVARVIPDPTVAFEAKSQIIRSSSTVWSAQASI